MSARIRLGLIGGLSGHVPRADHPQTIAEFLVALQHSHISQFISAQCTVIEEACAGGEKANNGGQRVTGLGDIAVWKFSSEGSLFNSGNLESCGPKGYLSLTLQGKRDEPTLKQAAINLATRVIERL